jgi:3-hydroxybutyryl-CoA dehydratase
MAVKFNIGDSYSFSKTISHEDVALYGKVTGDMNPIHFDEAYAKSTKFERNIVHGMFLLGLISNAIGNHLPGNGTIYSTQTVRFSNQYLLMIL